MDLIPWLSIITFWPLLGTVILLFWKPADPTIKRFAIGWSLVPTVLTTALWIGYAMSRGGIQFEEKAPWIPQIGITYNVGVDGLSVPLIWMAALMTTISLVYSA